MVHLVKKKNEDDKPILAEGGYYEEETWLLGKREDYMTDTEHAETYEQQVQVIERANQPILEGSNPHLIVQL